MGGDRGWVKDQWVGFRGGGAVAWRRMLVMKCLATMPLEACEGLFY